jgi:hypothetical protein
VKSTDCPPKTSDVKDGKENIRIQRELVTELKAQWKQMWKDRFNDKEKAEGISVTNYASLRVEQGRVIHATRNCKAPDFREILEQHKLENVDRLIQPHPRLGGWNKFIKNEIAVKKVQRGKRAGVYLSEKQKNQQPKKGGRGWLHTR